MGVVMRAEGDDLVSATRTGCWALFQAVGGGGGWGEKNKRNKDPSLVERKSGGEADN